MIVYQATNRITGERYIGCTVKALAARRRHHEQQSRTSQNCRRFHRALAKYGPDSFEWVELESFSSIDDMADAEERMIASTKPEYNIYRGGRLGWRGVAKTPEWRANIGRGNRGKKRSAEVKAMIGRMSKGRGLKDIVCADTGKTFRGYDAVIAEYPSLSHSNLNAVLRGATYSCGGLVFSFYDPAKPFSPEQLDRAVANAKIMRVAGLKRWKNKGSGW